MSAVKFSPAHSMQHALRVISSDTAQPMCGLFTTAPQRFRCLFEQVQHS